MTHELDRKHSSLSAIVVGSIVLALSGCSTTRQTSIEQEIIGTWVGESSDGRYVTLTITDNTINPVNMGAVPYKLDGNTLQFQIMGMDRSGVIESINDQELVMDFGDVQTTLKRKE